MIMNMRLGLPSGFNNPDLEITGCCWMFVVFFFFCLAVSLFIVGCYWAFVGVLWRCVLFLSGVARL